MFECSDIAGSDDVLSLNNESQDTLNEHASRMKKNASVSQTRENRKPMDQNELDEMEMIQADAPSCSQVSINAKQSSDITTQENPFIIPPPSLHSTLTDTDSTAIESSTQEETSDSSQSTSKSKSNPNTSGLDVSTTAENLRLYVSPSTSILETTANVDAATTDRDAESAEKLKEEPMDTNDGQVSLGSDGVIEPHPTSGSLTESEAATEKSVEIKPPTKSKITMSPATKSMYSLSQPATRKFDTILAKMTASPSISAAGNETDSTIVVREEEELFIKESISKTVRRYAVRVDQQGRTLSRELLHERVVEENTTSRIEPWPALEKQVRRPTAKLARAIETTEKKPAKTVTPKRKTKSLKPTPAVNSSKASKLVQSDDDETSKAKSRLDSSDSEDEAKEEKPRPNDDNEDDDDHAMDDVSGDEFIPTSIMSPEQPLKAGARVLAKWVDGHFYPGAVGSIRGDKFFIEFDDGAKRHVKPHEIIPQNYLQINQDVMAQTQDGYFDRGIIKRLVKKRKTGKLGYVVGKDGKEKWYPLRFISLTHEQAEQLPVSNHNSADSSTTQSVKRKRTSTALQSPKKKSKSSTDLSPDKSQRSSNTPSRRTKLFNFTYFLLTGFNDDLQIRHRVQDAIESHGGKVIEKIPPANRRERLYLVSDVARKTAKFFDAKKSNIPCVSYKWIDESVEKGEVLEWEGFKLVLPEKESKTTDDLGDRQNED